MSSPRVRYQQNYLHADGNLSYLDFIRVLDKIWSDSHPDIPLHAAGTYEAPTYPSIVYSLETRVPLDDDVKPRVRERILTAEEDDDVLIKGQGFKNYIKFTVKARHDPQQAESIIEVFEDFMMEFTPVFLQLGIKNIFYGRRQPDSEEVRQEVSIVNRSLTYLVITEKLIKVSTSKLWNVTADCRLFLQTNQATPDLLPATPPWTITANIVDTWAFSLYSATPYQDVDYVKYWDPDTDWWWYAATPGLTGPLANANLGWEGDSFFGEDLMGE